MNFPEIKGRIQALLLKTSVPEVRTLRIESLADLNYIVRVMDGQNLTDFLSQDNVRSQVTQQLTKLDDLVLFIMDTPYT
jgi:hypothetical protein|tara:strand:- start:206 stop:442 length:237 start_codon:yes stop_codon:yes gene_type:complete